MNDRQAPFLIVAAHGERCALHLGDIVEVMETFTTYPIPNAPPCFLGVMNFHGSPVPVLDLAAFLHGTPPKGSGPILVLDHRIASLALRVDAVERILFDGREGVTDLEEDGFLGPPVSGAGDEIRLLLVERVVERLDVVLRAGTGSAASTGGAGPDSP
ncbi:chemotaxis protein CheW [bacterium]|nr:chemotaxis protein CheW [bacterium]